MMKSIGFVLLSGIRGNSYSSLHSQPYQQLAGYSPGDPSIKKFLDCWETVDVSNSLDQCFTKCSVDSSAEECGGRNDQFDSYASPVLCLANATMAAAACDQYSSCVAYGVVHGYPTTTCNETSIADCHRFSLYKSCRVTQQCPTGFVFAGGRHHACFNNTNNKCMSQSSQINGNCTVDGMPFVSKMNDVTVRFKDSLQMTHDDRGNCTLGKGFKVGSAPSDISGYYDYWPSGPKTYVQRNGAKMEWNGCGYSFQKHTGTDYASYTTQNTCRREENGVTFGCRSDPCVSPNRTHPSPQQSYTSLFDVTQWSAPLAYSFTKIVSKVLEKHTKSNQYCPHNNVDSDQIPIDTTECECSDSFCQSEHPFDNSDIFLACKIRPNSCSKYPYSIKKHDGSTWSTAPCLHITTQRLSCASSGVSACKHSVQPTFSGRNNALCIDGNASKTKDVTWQLLRTAFASGGGVHSADYHNDTNCARVYLNGQWCQTLVDQSKLAVATNHSLFYYRENVSKYDVSFFDEQGSTVLFEKTDASNLWPIVNTSARTNHARGGLMQCVKCGNNCCGYRSSESLARSACGDSSHCNSTAHTEWANRQLHQLYYVENSTTHEGGCSGWKLLSHKGNNTEGYVQWKPQVVMFDVDTTVGEVGHGLNVTYTCFDQDADDWHMVGTQNVSLSMLTKNFFLSAPPAVITDVKEVCLSENVCPSRTTCYFDESRFSYEMKSWFGSPGNASAQTLFENTFNRNVTSWGINVTTDFCGARWTGPNSLPKTIASHSRLESRQKVGADSVGQPYARAAPDSSILKITRMPPTATKFSISMVAVDQYGLLGMGQQHHFNQLPGYTAFIGDVVRIEMATCDETSGCSCSWVSNSHCASSNFEFQVWLGQTATNVKVRQFGRGSSPEQGSWLPTASVVSQADGWVTITASSCAAEFAFALDRDECADGSHNCNYGRQCRNIDYRESGTKFQCVCDEGFQSLSNLDFDTTDFCVPTNWENDASSLLLYPLEELTTGITIKEVKFYSDRQCTQHIIQMDGAVFSASSHYPSTSASNLKHTDGVWKAQPLSASFESGTGQWIVVNSIAANNTYQCVQVAMQGCGKGKCPTMVARRGVPDLHPQNGAALPESNEVLSSNPVDSWKIGAHPWLKSNMQECNSAQSNVNISIGCGTDNHQIFGEKINKNGFSVKTSCMCLYLCTLVNAFNNDSPCTSWKFFKEREVCYLHKKTFTGPGGSTKTFRSSTNGGGWWRSPTVDNQHVNLGWVSGTPEPFVTHFKTSSPMPITDEKFDITLYGLFPSNPDPSKDLSLRQRLKIVQAGRSCQFDPVDSSVSGVSSTTTGSVTLVTPKPAAAEPTQVQWKDISISGATSSAILEYSVCYCDSSCHVSSQWQQVQSSLKVAVPQTMQWKTKGDHPSIFKAPNTLEIRVSRKVFHLPDLDSMESIQVKIVQAAFGCSVNADPFFSVSNLRETKWMSKDETTVRISAQPSAKATRYLVCAKYGSTSWFSVGGSVNHIIVVASGDDRSSQPSVYARQIASTQAGVALSLLELNGHNLQPSANQLIGITRSSEGCKQGAVISALFLQDSSRSTGSKLVATSVELAEWGSNKTGWYTMCKLDNVTAQNASSLPVTSGNWGTDLGQLSVTYNVELNLDFVVAPNTNFDVEVSGKNLDWDRDAVMVIDCQGTCGISPASKLIKIDGKADGIATAQSSTVDKPATVADDDGQAIVSRSLIAKRAYHRKRDAYCYGRNIQWSSSECQLDELCKAYSKFTCQVQCQSSPSAQHCAGWQPSSDNSHYSAMCLGSFSNVVQQAEKMCDTLSAKSEKIHLRCSGFEVNTTTGRTHFNDMAGRSDCESKTDDQYDVYEVMVDNSHNNTWPAVHASDDPNGIIFRNFHVSTGGTFKLCYCDSSLLKNRQCTSAKDFPLTVGEIHASGIQCLLQNDKLSRSQCVRINNNTIRCK